MNGDRCWLICLICDTGMRLTETAAFSIEDLLIEDEILHFIFHPPCRFFNEQAQKSYVFVSSKRVRLLLADWLNGV